MRHTRGAVRTAAAHIARKHRAVGVRRRWASYGLATGTAVVALVIAMVGVGQSNAQTIAALGFEVQNLDGSGNNIANPTWGAANQPYPRIGNARYADGRAQMVAHPNARFTSNRIFNDAFGNVFSARDGAQWLWAWGQFIDHNIGLKDGGAGEVANIPFNRNDPLENYRNNLGVIPFNRVPAAPGTGVNNARQQINTESSYIDADGVYSDSAARLDWLRTGSLDGNPQNNSASLMLPGGYLPRRDARGNPANIPGGIGDNDGKLLANPARGFVAGDLRVNENIFLSSIHTLFAREHNRIVAQLASTHPELSQEDQFQIARRVVSAEIQRITYEEWLPAMGVPIAGFSGYKPNVNAGTTNEFATAVYRAHTQIHGENEIEAPNGTWSDATLNMFRNAGIEVEVGAEDTALVIPLNVSFFFPDLLPAIGEGPVLASLSAESQYKNDQMIDNSLRSVLFQVPTSSGATCPGDSDAACFQGVVDLGAVDIERGFDHGMPSYNQFRQLLGLPARTSFDQVTGEPAGSQNANVNINDPNIVGASQKFDVTGRAITDDVDAEANTKRAVPNVPLAARLRAVFGSVDNIDLFTGAFSEATVAGSELGETARAAWVRQFQAMQDGDRFNYHNDMATLNAINTRFGIDFRRSLAQLITSDSDAQPDDVPPALFFAHGNVPVQSCAVQYQVTTTWAGHFQVNMTIFNTGSVPTADRWTLKFQFDNGQAVELLWNGDAVQEFGSKVTVNNVSWNGTIPAGGSLDGVGFNAAIPGNGAGARPSNFTLNTTRCSVR